MMPRAKRIYILMIKVKKLFSLFSSRCFLKEIENMYSVFLSSYRNTCGSLGEREMLWEHEPQASVSTAFWSSPKLSRVYISIETQQTCFLFLLESTAAKKRKTTSLLWSSKCKFSLLAPSLRQQLVPVLCLHRVIETRILTNQRAYFVKAVF